VLAAAALLPVAVGALKLLCERLFKVKSERQQLLLRGPGEAAAPAEDISGDDSKPLAFFSIQVGWVGGGGGGLL